jgi:hypothetical protein
VLFSLEKEHSYSADFLLATLTPSVDATPSSAATISHRDTAVQRRDSPVSILRNQTSSKSLSRALNSPSLPPNSPEQYPRLNSLSILDVNPPAVEREAEPEPETSLQPPAKRARARHIFQRCLQPSQDVARNLGEVLAPDSDSEM